MFTYARFVTLVALSLPAVAFAADEAPSVDTVKQTLERKLQSLKPSKTERNVVFQDVRAGTSSGGVYPFEVTAIVRDYDPGYPANHYYGNTCVGKMDKWRFLLSLDRFGVWDVQGRMTIGLAGGEICTPNPSEGVSSVPVSALR